MIISASSALFCIYPAFVLSEKLLGCSKYKLLWWFALTMPFVIPASLTGMGMISLCSKYILSGLYGSLLMPILANITRFLPIAVLIVFSQLKGIDSNLFEAAKVFRTGPLKTL
jgi:ABC-type Fe3+ transport system permease subunit